MTDGERPAKEKKPNHHLLLFMFALMIVTALDGTAQASSETLQSVTERGNTTNVSMTINGNLTITGQLHVNNITGHPVNTSRILFEGRNVVICLGC